MSGGLIGALKRANETRKPEDSIALRAAVLGAVMTSALALVFERAVAPTTGVLLMIALPFAYWVSYQRRDKDNWHIKIGLTIAAIFALMRFLGQLGGVATLDEVRFPLADLFLWVQVLHGFDLPARKDLNFSLGSSLTLIAVAGSISQDLRLLVFVVIYCVFVAVALALSHRSEVNERAAAWLRPAQRRTRPAPSRSLLRPLALTALSAVALFLVIPQPSGIRTFALPFSLGGVGGVFGGGGIANPGFSLDPGARASATSYYGFSERMDLSVRGDLPDTLVMRVRSSAPAMWRGVVFDTYDGTAWLGDPSTDHRTLGEVPPYAYPIEFRSLGPRQMITQTFYIEAEQANVVFAAGQPDSIWYDSPLSIDDLGGLRLDSTLTPGTVYSVVSSRGSARARELRALPSDEVPPENIERYLQLPAELPQRVADLARDITTDATSDYDRVKAIEAYLARNFEYNIDSPVPPPGRDAVDHFLFDTDVGFCEQFASATAVMLRTLGIPARVVAGYTPGGRNPFTGYHEVRASDAHAWVEVWFPRFGWYEFDPTFDIPPAHTTLAETLPLARVMRAVAEFVTHVMPSGMGAVLRTGLVGLLVAAIVVGIWIALRRRPQPAAAPAPPWLDAGPVVRAFARLEHSFARRGRRRGTAETAAEYLARTAYIGRSEIKDALGAFERERYSPEPPSPETARAAVATLEELANGDA